jgi:hypothetical protein
VGVETLEVLWRLSARRLSTLEKAAKLGVDTEEVLWRLSAKRP